MSGTKTVSHGPDCLACTDPAEAARQIAAERAELDVEAARASRHREAGERARRDHLALLLAGSPQAGEAQSRMLRDLGAANAIATGVRMRRAHLRRVEAAHPPLTRAAEGAGRG